VHQRRLDPQHLVDRILGAGFVGTNASDLIGENIQAIGILREQGFCDVDHLFRGMCLGALDGVDTPKKRHTVDDNIRTAINTMPRTTFWLSR